MNYYFPLAIIAVIFIFKYIFRKNSKRARFENATDHEENPLVTDSVQHWVSTKNKWLYPSDEFGVMEKGVVHDCKTYGAELNILEGESFEIINNMEKNI